METQKSEYIEIPNPSDLKFKPIVTGPSCSTNRLSKLIDILLQPFLNNRKSYIRDNIHFVISILQKIDPDIVIVTFYVTNLYSNISHELGKRAISFGIEKYPETFYPRFNKKFITDGIELIQNKNSFHFNNINYIQTLGTTMGIKIIPTCSTLTFAYLEENLFKIIGKKYNNMKRGHREDT